MSYNEYIQILIFFKLWLSATPFKFNMGEIQYLTCKA